MEVNELHIPIPFDVFNKSVSLSIYPENSSKLFLLLEEEAMQNGESSYQILEGNGYDYTISDKDFILDCSYKGIVTRLAREQFSGRIVPNIYVGTLTLDLKDISQPDKVCKVLLEVLATKFDNDVNKSYREHYRFMLKDITDKCTELLMQVNSPIEQHFETDFSRDNETVYQKFSFISSIINNKDFDEAVLKIIASPKTNWDTEEEVVDIRRVKRFTNAATKQIISGSNRISLPQLHSLHKAGITSLPNKIKGFRKIEHTDTPENRFIKHALEVFLKFGEECQDYFKNKKYARPHLEASNLVNKLDGYLGQSFFKAISRPTSLKLNSPVLQRKSGYREVLSAWLQFDLAAKLVWKGGDDVYQAGKRDIATLYEYWLFFTLYDLFEEKFKLSDLEHEEKAYDHLFEYTKNQLNIRVKQGKHTALSGVFTTGGRAMHIKFSYNRSFKGGTQYSEGKEGSYTTTLRPDYTLSIWPCAVGNEKDAEKLEMMVHIHFDAKYKVQQFIINTSTDSESLDEEKNNERKGTYKNADLLKMHAYKDAIRRTGGAYVLYPGTQKKEIRGFHEIIPGLGAFAINPSENKDGLEALSVFVDSVVNHLVDRASQRENVSSKAHLIYKNVKEDSNYLHQSLPEYLNGRKLIPDETFVLVGYYKTPEQLKWILEYSLYNFRTGTDKGSLSLGKKEMGATFLVLHGPKETVTDKIYKLKEVGPKIYSKQNLINKKYPTVPKGELYIMYEIENDMSVEFENQKWDLKKLENYSSFWNSAKPITVTLSELMMVKVVN